MKKVMFFSVAALALLGTACSQDDMPELRDGSTATFTVSVPAELGTRYGDGTAARNLYVAIYDSNAEEGAAPLFTNFGGTTEYLTVTATGSDAEAVQTWEVSVPMVKNKSYDLVFWAQSGEAATATEAAPNGTAMYSYNLSTRNIVVNYANYAAYDESRDAFYKAIPGFISKGVDNGTIELTRPFAQVNIGTTDLADYMAASGDQNPTFGMKVGGVSNCLNLMSNEVTTVNDFDGNVTVPNAAAEPNGLVINETTSVTYLAMGYLLVGDSQNTKGGLDVTLTTGTDDNFANYGNNVPAKMNYRTNIYGRLLTNLEDFTITLDPNFGPNNSQNLDLYTWTGGVKEIIPVNNVYTINTPEELAWIAQVCNTNHSYFKGSTFNLNADLNLNNLPWTPIYITPTGKGETFNGNSHTIYGLSSPLFAMIGGNISDLTLSNANITKPYATSGTDMYGVLGAMMNASLNNVTVKNSTITVGDAGKLDCAGALGAITGTGNFTNCTVENVTFVNATHNSGGLFGNMNADVKERTMTNCVVKNTNVGTGTAGGQYVTKNGALIGLVLNVDLTNNGSYATNTTPDVLYGAVVGASTSGGEVLPGYPELFVDTKNKTAECFTPQGFSSMITYIQNNIINNSFAGFKLELTADVDMTGITMTDKFVSPGSNYVDGFELNGNGHTISNMTIVGHGMFNGDLGGSKNGAKTAVIRDLTIDNAYVDGQAAAYHVGVVVGQVACGLDMINVHVTNSTVIGKCNVGGLMGSAGGEHGYPPTITFQNCSVTNTKLTALGGSGVDPCGANVFVGRVCNTRAGGTTINFLGNNTYSNVNMSNGESVLGGGIYGYASVFSAWYGVGVCDSFTNYAGETATQAAQDAALAAGKRRR